MAIARSSVAVAVALALSTSLAAHAQSSPPSGEETPLPEVRVTADSGPNTSASTGALGDKPVLDTPFSIDVVDQESIENRQAITIGDVFKLDPSVTVFDDGYIGEASGIAIRGLQLDLLNGYKVDGLAIANWGSDLPVEHFQRIELLKGSGGFMYGFGSPGGIANFVLKRPTNEPLRSVTVGYMNDATLKGQVDLGGRFGEDNMFGYRINAVQEQGDTFVNDGGYIRRTSGIAAIDWRITPDLVFQADGLFQKRRVYAAYYGVVPYQDYGLPDDFLQ
ncbi:MAG: TonB-dependent receptor plug domain-containing protein, partial [Burkholderiales bacterium]